MADATPATDASIDFSDPVVVDARKKRKKKDDDRDGTVELRDLQRAVKATAKGSDAVVKAVNKGIEAWNEAWEDAEEDDPDGPAKGVVDIWAAGASATLEGLAEAPRAFAETWDKPLKVKRLRRMMPVLPRWVDDDDDDDEG